jgi:hypothetical protein
LLRKIGWKRGVGKPIGRKVILRTGVQTATADGFFG